jgi:lipopolysaccharide/colanic/teichoic acid biosynthesis glycosyltransferase/glycosyltransferase involved in cell wall biosynthesis
MGQRGVDLVESDLEGEAVTLEVFPARAVGPLSQEEAAMGARISVVVPAYNAASTITDCLTGLLSQTIPNSAYKVIVVDDGSEDETYEMARRFPVLVLRQAHRGAAAARNLGIEHATGELVLFTDADCVPTSDWIERMAEPFEDPSVAGVKGVYATGQQQLLPRFVQAEYAERYARMAGYSTIDFVDTYSAGYRRSVLLSVGRFDTRLPGAIVEDQELSFRVAEAGYRLLYVPGAVVFHNHPTTIGAYFRRKFAIGYWKVPVHRRHPGKLLSDSHTPQVLKAQIVLVGLGLVSIGGWLLGLHTGLLLLAAIGLFLLSTLPFIRRCWRRDRAVAVVSPTILLWRSIALGSGLAAGTLGWLANSQCTKRTMDLIGATAGLVLSAPIILPLAVVIRMDSPGPSLLALPRIGQDRRQFKMYKLRTMVQGAEGMWSSMDRTNVREGNAFKDRNDPRITRVGRFLRRLSLDELPQFLNVFRGDMSLVGPRPEVPELADEYYADWYWAKFSVRPGMTGPMQVNGRGDLSLDERARLELAYIENRSLWQDLTILARTLPAVFSGRGSY